MGVQQMQQNVQQMQQSVQQFCSIPDRQRRGRVATRFDAYVNETATHATDAAIYAAISASDLLHDKDMRHNDLSINAANAAKNFLKVYNGKEIAKKMRIRANIHAYKILPKMLLHLLHLLHG